MTTPAVVQRAMELYPSWNIWKSSILRGRFSVFAESDLLSSVESTAAKASLYIDPAVQQSILDVGNVYLQGKPSLFLSSGNTRLQSETQLSLYLSQPNLAIQSWTKEATTLSSDSIQFQTSSGTPLISFTSSSSLQLPTGKKQSFGSTVTFGASSTAPHTFIFGNDSAAYVSGPLTDGINERKWEFQVHGSPSLRLSRTEVATLTNSTSISNGGLVVTPDKTTATSVEIPSGNLFLGSNRLSVFPMITSHETQLTNVSYQLPGYKGSLPSGTTLINQNVHVAGTLWTEDHIKQATYEVGPWISDLDNRTKQIMYSPSTTTITSHLALSEGNNLSLNGGAVTYTSSLQEFALSNTTKLRLGTTVSDVSTLLTQVSNKTTNLSYSSGTTTVDGTLLSGGKDVGKTLTPFTYSLGTTTIDGTVLIQGKDVGQTLTPFSYSSGTTTVDGTVLIQGKDVGQTLTPFSYSSGITTVNSEILSLTDLGQSYSNAAPTFTSSGKTLVTQSSVNTLVATIVVPKQSNKTVVIHLPLSVYRLGSCSSSSTSITHTETLSNVTATYWKDGIYVGACDVSTDLSLPLASAFTSLGSAFEYHQFATMIHLKFPPTILATLSSTYQVFVSLTFSYANNASGGGVSVTTNTFGWYVNTDLSSRIAGMNVTYQTAAGTGYQTTNLTRDLSLTNTTSYGSGLPSLAIADLVTTNLRVGNTLYANSATITNVPKWNCLQNMDIGIQGGSTWIRNDLRLTDVSNRSNNSTFMQMYLTGNAASFIHFVPNTGYFSFLFNNGSATSESLRISPTALTVSSGNALLLGTKNVGTALAAVETATTDLTYDAVNDASCFDNHVWLKNANRLWLGGSTMGDSNSINVGNTLSTTTTKLTNLSFANNTTTVSNTFKVGTIDVGSALTALTYSSGTSSFASNLVSSGTLSASNGAFMVGTNSEVASTLPLRLRQGNTLTLANTAETNQGTMTFVGNNWSVGNANGGGWQFQTKRTKSTLWTTAGSSFLPFDLQPEKIIFRTGNGGDGTPTVEVADVGNVDNPDEQRLQLFGCLGTGSINPTSVVGDLGVMGVGVKDSSFLNLSVWTTAIRTGLRIGPEGSVLSAGNYTLTGNANSGFTFAGGSIPPLCSSVPAADSHLVNKKYVDGKSGALTYAADSATTTLTGKMILTDDLTFAKVSGTAIISGNLSFSDNLSCQNNVTVNGTSTFASGVVCQSGVELQSVLYRNTKVDTSSYIHLGHHFSYDQSVSFSDSTITTVQYQMGSWSDSLLGKWMYTLTLLPALNYGSTRDVTIGYYWSSALTVPTFNPASSGNIGGSFLTYEQTFYGRSNYDMLHPMTFTGILISGGNTAIPFRLFLKLMLSSTTGASSQTLNFKVNLVRIA